MANSGIFNHLHDPRYAGILTILSYQTTISDYISSLHLDVFSKPIIIDTALKGGSDFERFIECEVNDKGLVEYKTAILVKPSDELRLKADFLLSLNETPVKNSPLTRSQKSKILQYSTANIAL